MGGLMISDQGEMRSFSHYIKLDDISEEVKKQLEGTIDVYEAFAVWHAIRVWQKNLEGKHVIFHVDNTVDCYGF